MRTRNFLTEHKSFVQMNSYEYTRHYIFKAENGLLSIVEDSAVYRIGWDSNTIKEEKELPEWFRQLKAQLQLEIIKEERLKIQLGRNPEVVLTALKQLYIEAKKC